MKAEIKIDNNFKEPIAIIHTEKITDEVTNAIKFLSDNSAMIITGFYDDMAEIIEPADIIKIYAASGKVYALTSRKEYIVRMRIYEFEEKLDKTQFVRISNSEIINLRRAIHFDLKLTGTICVSLENDNTAYVSRRYVSKIKQILGV